MKSKVKFPSSGEVFYADLRKRVNAHFKQHNISIYANSAMWTKTTLFLVSFISLYLGILFIDFSPLILLGMSILLGMNCAFVGFNICHDAIHGSFSKHKAINRIFSFLFNLIGASPYVWSITHNLVHHTYTNIPGHDEDIEVAPGLIRICEEDELRPIHKFQHWYAFPLYSLASLSWVFRKDFKKFFQHSVGSHQNKHQRKEYFNLFIYKGMYYFLFIILPLFVMEISWWQFLIGFISLHLAEGLTMGLVFQLAHVVEGTAFPFPNEKGNMEEAWAEHQMRTTANFASQNKFAAFFLGGLNRQIEHHLFPKICHIHYGRISAIVKQTAFEHQLPYHESKTFLIALRSHYCTLKKFGSINSTVQ